MCDMETRSSGVKEVGGSRILCWLRRQMVACRLRIHDWLVSGLVRRSGARRPPFSRTGRLVMAAIFCASTILRAQGVAGPCVGLNGNFCSQPVGSLSGEQNIGVVAGRAGTVSSVEVLTWGVSGLDFSPGLGAITCPAMILNVGSTCIESVIFEPQGVGLRLGAVVLFDSGNNVLGTAFLWGTGVSGLGVLIPGNMVPIAGDGDSTGSVLDGQAATSASLDLPSSVVLDGAGNLYIADRSHNRIRKVTAASGIISTLAGNGTAGYSGDSDVSTDGSVSLNAPWGVAMDGAGNLYIADTGNHVVREIEGTTGVIGTVAGTGMAGDGGDGGPADQAALNQPQGVSLDANGNLYIADTHNHRIRKVNSAGIITTVAGNGMAGNIGDHGAATTAELNLPFAVTFDASGNMFIPDSGNNVVRRVDTSGIITTFAGTGAAGYTGDNGPAAAATLFSPSGVAADAGGNVYIADTKNSCIRKVNAASGLISTIAANGIGEYVYNHGGPYTVSLNEPLGLSLDGSGNLYFADSLNMRVGEIQSNLGLLDYSLEPVRQGDLSAPQQQTIENDGNAPLSLTAMVAAKNAVLAPAETSCNIGLPSLALDTSCEVGIIFAPTAPGNPVLGNLDVSSNAPNAPLEIELIGNAQAVAPTMTALTASPAPSGFGASVLLVATVSATQGAGNLTGTISFLDGAKVLQASVPMGATSAGSTTESAQASLTTAGLAVGSHALTASYSNSNDMRHGASVSPTVTQLVLEATSTVLASSLNPAAPGQSFTLTATVTSLGGGQIAPDGTVVFTDGVATLCTSVLNAGQVATCTAAGLQNGLHSIVATYGGDSAHEIQGSVSELLKQEVLEPSLATIMSTPNPSYYGEPVTFTVSVASSGQFVPTGNVNILDAGRQVGSTTLAATSGIGAFTTSALPAGANVMVAAYMGDSNDAATNSAAITEVVNRAQTAVSVAANPSPAIAGAMVAIAAAVAVTRGISAPTGAVTFTDTFNGAKEALGTAQLGTGGTALIRPAFMAGLHSIVATYAGDSNNGGSISAPLELTVLPGSTSVVLTSAPNPSALGVSAVFTATVTGSEAVSGTVAFFADGKGIGTATLGAKSSASLSDSTLSFGAHSMTAAYGGDGNDNPSTSATLEQIVGKIPTVTNLSVSSTAGASAQVSLLATVSGATGPTATGTVTFTVGTTSLGLAAVNAGGTATLTPSLAAGTYLVVAAYGGDSLHLASASQALQVQGTATSFSLAVTPAAQTVATKQSAVFTVNLSSVDNFSDTIALACGSLPSGVTCHFANASVGLRANGTQAAQLTIDTDDPLSSGAATMIRDPSKPATMLAGMLLPGGIFIACVLLGWRSRRVGRGGVLLLAVFAALAAGGCSSVSQTTAAAGTYVIEVIGTGASSGVSHNQNVTLTITK